jgi:hypothetical protein
MSKGGLAWTRRYYHGGGYYHHHDSYWAPLAGFAIGALVGGLIASQPYYGNYYQGGYCQAYPAYGNYDGYYASPRYHGYTSSDTCEPV